MVAAARRVFGERGYDAASMDEIAAAAGISKPMVYAYFGSKEELFAACVQRGRPRLPRRACEPRPATRGTAPPDQRLSPACSRCSPGIERDRDAWDLLYPSRGKARAARSARGQLRAVRDDRAGRGADGRPARAQGCREEMLVQRLRWRGRLRARCSGLVDWWRRHPDEPKELQAVRAMNFAWRGFEQLLAGEVWLPLEVDISR